MHWFKSLVVLHMLVWMTLLSVGGRAQYNIWIGKSDITDPAAEVIMKRFLDLKESTAGIINRLSARVFLIEDPDTSNRVIGVYTDQNVVLHATHALVGPGGKAGYFLYDVSILGYISKNVDMIVSGILNAIDKPHNSVVSGTIRWNKGEVAQGGTNRSLNAYLANPESERAKYSSSINTTMRVLQFFSSEGKLRGVLAFYPVHPISLTAANLLISGGNKGFAEFLLEDELDNVVVGIGITNAGDVSPNLTDNGDRIFKGEGNPGIESAEIMGKRQYDTLSALIKIDSELIEGPIVARLSYVDFSNVTLDGVQATTDDPYADKTCPAVVGQHFAAGTEDGCGLSMFREGGTKTNKLFKAIGGIIKKIPK
ncbi:hypothetical protein PHYSODRAFT_246129 [Phytophthora sojae]|uniref:Neutral ceramidase n=1 Tax=Phytophthora sojae (strain P6497) TaxID=1094619 RepID=G4YVT8_PHYSP|nr:hypothetical protein PHYSODRAFT_246129 [Phytophthora sojae]EGZ23186.1 hypothetical protein PHYSODRAFT_246129 [Phytophthora sojae]|eukprot:XP_009518474.1 hypothetical protein PHYSODRAFT_246129 [Phytophthora sojae]